MQPLLKEKNPARRVMIIDSYWVVILFKDYVLMLSGSHSLQSPHHHSEAGCLTDKQPGPGMLRNKPKVTQRRAVDPGNSSIPFSSPAAQSEVETELMSRQGSFLCLVRDVAPSELCEPGS